MAKSGWRWGWQLGVVSLVAMGGAIASSGNYAFAQIAPDNTLGAESSVVTPNAGNVNEISGGATRGANLFHSFEQFSVRTGGEAFFNNAASIQNIISRVTGGSVSNIDGLLRANGTANLFLINPRGIVFGPNASLNIGGSFVGSTASAVNFADGSQFSATAPQTTPLLSVSVPQGLQFGGNAGSIRNQSRVTNSNGEVVGLQVLPGKTLALVGGNVQLNGGSLFARSGRVELGGALGAGTVGLNLDSSNLSLSFSDSLARSDVSLTNNSEVNVRSFGGGSIAINAQNLNMAGGSKLRAGIDTGLGSPESAAGDIALNATRAIALTDGSFIANVVNSGAVGKGGNINIQAGSLSLTNGAYLNANTYGQGDAGSVTITASDTITFDGVGSDGSSSSAFSAVADGAVGKGGNVNVTTRSLSLTNGAYLNANTYGQGDAGSVTITASDTITFDGVGSDGSPSGAESTVADGAVGKGGNVNVTTRSLSLTNGATLNANTFGQGDAGSVTITASDTITFDGVGTTGSSTGAFSGVGNRRTERQAVGNGGNVNVKARSLFLRNGAVLSTGTFARGNAGNVSINADTVSFDGVGSNERASGAYGSVNSGGVGNGGNINITAGSLSLTNGAQLRASTFGRGNAGSVTINARDTVSFDGSDASSSVRSGAFGNGGSVNITAGSLSLTNGAQLSTSTFGKGDAGRVSVQATDAVTLHNSNIFSNVESGGVGKGGGISIAAGSLELTNGAQLQSGLGGERDGLPGGRGQAGSVNIDVRDTVTIAGVDNDRFSSAIFGNVGSGAVGTGSDITIRAGSVSLSDGGRLVTSTAGEGNAGNVTIQARDAVSLQGVGSNELASGASSSVNPGGVGNGGNINIKAGSLSLTDGAQLSTSTFGKGDAGRVSVQATDAVTLDNSNILSNVESGGVGKVGGISIAAGSLELTNGAQLQSGLGGERDGLPGGRGQAGSVNIDVRDTVTIAGVDNDGFSSAIVGDVESGAVGTGSDITIKAGSVSLSDGGRLITTTAGEGNAGNVTIQARDAVSLQGVGSNELASGASSSVRSGGVGNGGNINIKAGSLSLNDGAVLDASTFGQGDAGNVNISSDDTVSFDGFVVKDGFSFYSAAFSGVFGNGKGGDINITTGSLSVTNGAELVSGSYGQGDAGNINISSDDTVSFDGQAIVFSAVGSIPPGFFSGRLAELIPAQGIVGNGKGGDIRITARSLSLSDGALILSSTFGQGDAGNIFVQARDSVSLGSGTGIASTVESRALGNGGNINITTESLSLTDGVLSATSSGNGAAGNIEATADSIRLDNRATLSADTTAGQGNIILRSGDLVLRKGSNITTSATGTATGGNITIDTGVLAALENSDIRANAQEGPGGRVIINAQGIFGTEFRDRPTRESDITASSDLGPEFSGIVEINNPDVDPSQGLVELPAEVVDASNRIASGCAARENKLSVIGRGGLPPNPREPLNGEAVLTNWATLSGAGELGRGAENRETNSTNSTSSTPTQIVEATGWVVNDKGEVVLTASAPTDTLDIPWLPDSGCHASKPSS